MTCKCFARPSASCHRLLPHALHVPGTARSPRPPRPPPAAVPAGVRGAGPPLPARDPAEPGRPRLHRRLLAAARAFGYVYNPFIKITTKPPGRGLAATREVACSFTVCSEAQALGTARRPESMTNPKTTCGTPSGIVSFRIHACKQKSNAARHAPEHTQAPDVQPRRTTPPSAEPAAGLLLHCTCGRGTHSPAQRHCGAGRWHAEGQQHPEAAHLPQLHGLQARKASLPPKVFLPRRRRCAVGRKKK